MTTKLTKLQEACRRVDVAVPWSKIDVVGFAFGRVSAVVFGHTSSNDALRRTTEVSGLQNNYARLAAQFSSVTIECGTWRLLVRERNDDIILRPSLDKSKDNFKLIEDQDADVQKEKEADGFEQDA